MLATYFKKVGPIKIQELESLKHGCRVVTKLSERLVSRIAVSIALSTLLICSLIPTTAGAAQRQVDSSSCSPKVSLSITPPADVTTWAFEESIGRLTPTNISGNGVWIEAEGVIRWGADLAPLTATLSYDLSGSDGSYRVSGRESLDGQSTTAGEDQVLLSCESDSAPETVSTPSFSQPSGTRVPQELQAPRFTIRSMDLLQPPPHPFTRPL